MQIAILRIGTVDEHVLRKVQSGLVEIYPETECLIHDKTMSIPADAYNMARQQFYSTHILAKISSYVRQTQADHILGVTAVDLYVPQLNFVFGEATCPGKAAIISLFRLKPEFYGHSANREVLIERCIKEAVHEIGHTLSLRHCQNPTCAMFFSNSILDTDRKGKVFCENCYSKVVRLSGAKSHESHK
ncbi:MAG: archaemetzincin family Zn-dependent metalloprotease [Candidatus Bathyarchaeia archaeon]